MSYKHKIAIRSRPKNPPPLMPHAIHMVRFMITFTLCSTMSKHSQYVGAKLGYCLILGPLFWEINAPTPGKQSIEVYGLGMILRGHP
jgi:hypothetical protein